MARLSFRFLRSARNWLSSGRNRAFVAAPLLGTIIFLSCVVFIVNLNKIENANVVLSENEAYHNRIVSLLEMYRSDTASTFRQQLTFVIEHFLSSGCWLNLFDVDNTKPELANPVGEEAASYENNKIPRLTTAAGEDYSIQELRYAKCKNVNKILSEIMQSVNTCKAYCTPKPQGYCDCKTQGGAQCSTYEHCAANDVGCKSCLNKLYGLPKVIDDLSRDMTFEGVVFRASNPDEFNFTKYEAGGPQALRFSSTVIRGSLFDCREFAKTGAFSCCSVSGDFFDEHASEIGSVGAQGYRPSGAKYEERYVYDWETPCEERDEGGFHVDGIALMNGDAFPMPGCEDGSFFVRIGLNNSFVYQRMPRFMADDSVGNQLRTSALGEADFNIPISYPLYEYMNYSFQLYEMLAYGPNKNSHDDADEGIAEGLCVESTAPGALGDCSDLQGYADEGFPGTARGSVPQCKVGSEEDCKTNLKNAFIENRLKNSCDEFTNSIENRGDVSVFLCLQDDYDGFPDDQPACSENPESWHYTCGQNSGDDLYSKFSEDERLTQVKLPEPYVAPCPTSNPPQSSDPVCAALGKDSSSRVTLSVRFNDLRDENRVDPDYQNRFCADIRIMHHSS